MQAPPTASGENHRTDTEGSQVRTGGEAHGTGTPFSDGTRLYISGQGDAIRRRSEPLFP